MVTLIQNGTVVMEDGVQKADILIEGETIKEIGADLDRNVDIDKRIDADGCYVLPGGIDVHTHLDWNFADMKTADDFITGSKAAAVGGITSIINFTNRGPEQTLLEDLMEWKERAKPCNVDYGFHVIINDYNEEMLNDLPKLLNEGVSSIKLFMAYKNVFMVDDGTMYDILKEAARLGFITCVHAENGDVIDRLVQEHIDKGLVDPVYHSLSRPPELEAEATHRAITIAELVDAPLYIVHVSCSLALEEIRKAKKRGSRIHGETCPQYLALDITDLKRPGQEGGKYVCSPPLREKWNQEKLWQGLSEGTLSTIGSDHSPFQYEQKKRLGEINFARIPNGVPVIEDQYSIVFHHGVLEKKMALNTFAEITSTNPAKLFGMYPKKGTIKVNADADIVILNPDAPRIISQASQVQNVDYNAFEGKEVNCSIEYVLSRGEVVSEKGSYIGEEGRGKFIYRKPSNG
ncbi:dihydropyrimidinase [Halalkalibacter oceani]|uniref:dihydropyrimidinase n=1 Tax=Halalkalibacter oceani TaxID=1653776 RepID=UPI003393ECDC